MSHKQEKFRGASSLTTISVRDMFEALFETSGKYQRRLPHASGRRDLTLY
jgi:hypothetical protein